MRVIHEVSAALVGVMLGWLLSEFIAALAR